MLLMALFLLTLLCSAAMTLRGFTSIFEMACLYPFYVKDQPVPCGRCPNCLARRTQSWVFRIGQEMKRSHSEYWLRLSYDSEHLPYSPNGYPTLERCDVQKWLKRLRKALPLDHQPIKYFLCGEYGSLHSRPHYHVLLFNLSDVQYAVDAWSLDGRMIGDVYVDPRPINDACIAYTVGYMGKQRGRRLAKNDDRQKEFLLMSKRLGDNYLTEAVKAYHL